MLWVMGLFFLAGIQVLASVQGLPLMASGCIIVDGTPHERIYESIRLSDGSLVLAGYTEYVGNRDVLLLRVSASGSVMWARKVGWGGMEEAYHLFRLSSGDFVAVGYTNSWGQGNADVLVIRFTSTGVIQWIRTIGGPANDYGYGGMQDPSGRIFIVGKTYSYYAGSFVNADAYIIRLSPSGSLSWAKHYGGPQEDEARAIAYWTSSRYIVVGSTRSWGQGLRDVWLFAISPTSGSVSWARTMGGSWDDVGMDVIRTSDGGFFFAGYTSSYSNNGSYNVYVGKFSSSGGLQWSRAAGSSADDQGFSAVEVPGSGTAGYKYAVGGTSASANGNGMWDVYIVKFSSSGWLHSTYLGGKAADDLAYDIVYHPGSGGFITAGATYSSFLNGSINPSGSAIFLVHLDASGGNCWHCGSYADGSALSGGVPQNLPTWNITVGNGGSVSSPSLSSAPVSLTPSVLCGGIFSLLRIDVRGRWEGPNRVLLTWTVQGTELEDEGIVSRWIIHHLREVDGQMQVVRTISVSPEVQSYLVSGVQPGDFLQVVALLTTGEEIISVPWEVPPRKMEGEILSPGIYWVSLKGADGKLLGRFPVRLVRPTGRDELLKVVLTNSAVPPGAFRTPIFVCVEGQDCFSLVRQ